MNAVIFNITLRQVLGRRRSLLMILFALLPVLVAVVFQFAGDVNEIEASETQDFTANGLLDALVISTLLPLVALVFGTAVLGAEIDDGTAVYLLSKPEPRWRILATKLVVAWLCTAVMVTLSAVAAGAVAIAGAREAGIVTGFAVAALVGSFAYSCIFVTLSVVTSRALIVGLIYVFLWERVVTLLFAGTRFFSVHDYSIAIADAISGVSRSIFEARMEGVTAIVLLVAVSAAAFYVGVRRLERFEIGETS
jgi:ABC-2 type transport system permease protein